MSITEKIGIIGGGISGLSAAWHLSKDSEVVLFEKNSYLGGHAHTVEVKDVDKRLEYHLKAIFRSASELLGTFICDVYLGEILPMEARSTPKPKENYK